jgi:hypothetical protein
MPNSIRAAAAELRMGVLSSDESIRDGSERATVQRVTTLVKG